MLRRPMMNYYEEFGVPQDATVEEIRQAYKTLARVLHPDSQTDEKLRAAAASQMKRLHEVLDILVDPAKRRAYDASFAPAAYSSGAMNWAPYAGAAPFLRPLGNPGLAQSALRHWFWILIGGMILGSGFWYLTARAPAPPESSANAFSAAPPPDGAGPVSRPAEPAAKHASGAGARSASGAPPALPEAPRPRKSDPPEPPDVSVPVPVPAVITSLPPVVTDSARPLQIPQPATTPPVPGVRRSSFAGDWFYVPASEIPDAHLYPPVDIDLQLVEKDGFLTGQYRGRYKVPDAAVSQDVLFQVQGKIPRGGGGGSVLDVRRRSQRHNRSRLAPAKFDACDVVDNPARTPSGFEFRSRHPVPPTNAVTQLPGNQRHSIVRRRPSQIEVQRGQG